MPKTMQQRNEKKISKVIGWTEMANGFHKCSWFSIPEWKTMGDQRKATFSRYFPSRKAPCLVNKSFSFWYWKLKPVCVNCNGCLNICWDWWPNTWRGRDWLSQCLTFPTPWEIVSHPQSCRKNYLPLHSRLRWSFGVLGHKKSDETDFRFLLILTQTTKKTAQLVRVWPRFCTEKNVRQNWSIFSKISPKGRRGPQ